MELAYIGALFLAAAVFTFACRKNRQLLITHCKVRLQNVTNLVLSYEHLCIVASQLLL